MTLMDRPTAPSSPVPPASAPPPASATSLDVSRDFCQKLTRRQARNFYYGLKLLPHAKRTAMYALYAYMRLVDDIADDGDQPNPTQRHIALDQWQTATHVAIDAAALPAAVLPTDHPLWPAFTEMIRNYRVPTAVFDDMIAGQRQDLQAAPIPDFAALRDYCYRVASVVGVASLYVFGFQHPDSQSTAPDSQTLQLGIDRGIAFQLTNILRDLREDSARARCYMPEDELRRFNVTAAQIAAGKDSADFQELMKFQLSRARQFYGDSASLEQRIHPDARPTLRAMTEIYRGLLEKIAQKPARVLQRRVRLSAATKLLIGWRAMRGKS